MDDNDDYPTAQSSWGGGYSTMITWLLDSTKQLRWYKKMSVVTLTINLNLSDGYCIQYRIVSFTLWASSITIQLYESDNCVKRTKWSIE